MAASFWIKSITFTGKKVEDSTITFKPGFNIIHGASDTGKTYLAKSIQYMLAGKTRPFSEDTGYEEIHMRLQAGEYELQLHRKIGQSKMTVTGGYELGIVSGEYDVVNTESNPDGYTISDVLLRLIGIREAGDIITNQYGGRKKMSWRSFAKTLYRGEQQITSEDSIFDGAKFETLSALSRLLFDSDLTLVKQTTDPAAQKREKEVLGPYLSTQLDEMDVRRGEIQDELKELGAYDSLEHQKRLQEVLANLVVKQDVVRRELSDLAGQATKIRQEIQQHLLMKQKYEELQTIYVGNLNRLGLVTSAEEALGGLEVPTHCPFCDNELSERKQEQYAAPARAETASTIGNIQSLREVQASNEKKLGLLDAALETVEIKQRELEDHLANAVLPKIQILESDIAHIKRYESLKAQEEQLEERYGQFRDRLTKLLNPDEVKASFDPLEQFQTDFFEKMTSNIRLILEQTRFVNPGQVRFDRESFDIVIGGKHKRSHGKGYRAFYNTIVFLALRRYFAEYAVYKPGVFVIDTPTLGLEHQKTEGGLVTTREPETGRPVTGLLRELFDAMADSGQEGQLIILNNTDVTPTSDFSGEDMMELRFGSEDEGAHQKGLLKTTPQ